jgi:hypothetical protein
MYVSNRLIQAPLDRGQCYDNFFRRFSPKNWQYYMYATNFMIMIFYRIFGRK